MAHVGPAYRIGTARSSNGVPVDVYKLDSFAYERAARLLHTNMWVATCRHAVVAETLSTPPDFYWKDEQRHPSPAFAALISERWMPTAENVMNFVWTLGVVPVRLVRDGAEYVPEVVKGTLGHDYEIGTYIDDYDMRQRYVFWDLRAGSNATLARNAIGFLDNILTPTANASAIDTHRASDGERDADDPTRYVHVLSGFGYDPTPLGELRSPLSAMLRDHDYEDMMALFDARGEALRSDPALLTETAPESAGVLRDKDRIDYFRDGDATRRDSQHAFVRNDSELALVQHHQMAVYGEEAVDGAHRGSALRTGDIDRPMPLNNVFPLPVNHRLAQQTHPPARGDRVAARRMFQDMVAAAMGLPRSSLIADTGHSSTNAQVASRVVHVTVAWWRALLSRFFTYMYRASPYDVQDTKESISQQLLRYVAARSASLNGVAELPSGASPSVGDEAPMSPEEMFGKDLLSPVTVRFSVASTAAGEEVLSQLFGAYASAVIDYPAYCRQTRAHLGLANSPDRPPTKDPFSRDEKLGILRQRFAKPIKQLAAVGDRIFPDPEKEKKETEKRKAAGKPSKPAPAHKEKERDDRPTKQAKQPKAAKDVRVKRQKPDDG